MAKSLEDRLADLARFPCETATLEARRMLNGRVAWKVTVVRSGNGIMADTPESALGKMEKEAATWTKTDEAEG